MCPPKLSLLNNLGGWCNRAVHLQCAGSKDTLSPAYLGAQNVIGIDISEEMINKKFQRDWMLSQRLERFLYLLALDLD